MQVSFELDPLTLTPKEQIAHDLAVVRAKHYRMAEVDLMTSIEEVDRLRLFEKFRLESIHAYCRDILKLSDAVASNFICVAKKTRVVEGFKEAIAEGDISMSTARKMCSVINAKNKDEWLEKGKTSTTAEIEREVAKVHPQAVKRDHVKPVGPDRNRIAFEASDEYLEMQKRITELERKRLGRTPTRGEVLLEMAKLYLKMRDPLQKADRAKKRKQKPTATPAKKPNGERAYKPKNIEHAVNERDRGRCAVVVNGKRCGSTHFVHQHHIVGVAKGGAHAVENIITVCSAHHRQIHEDQEYTV